MATVNLVLPFLYKNSQTSIVYSVTEGTNCFNYEKFTGPDGCSVKALCLISHLKHECPKYMKDMKLK
jgi:hypothetical protein